MAHCYHEHLQSNSLIGLVCPSPKDVKHLVITFLFDANCIKKMNVGKKNQLVLSIYELLRYPSE